MPILISFDHCLTELSPKNTIFRIYRDTRFSNDKSPYKTNLGSYLVGGGKKSGRSGYCIHIDPDSCFLGVGIYSPDSKTLQNIRQEILKDPQPLRAILEDKQFKITFTGLCGEQLKTAPRGIAKDHPVIDLVRYKHYTVFQNISDADVLSKKFLKICVDAFHLLYPLNVYLNGLLR